MTTHFPRIAVDCRMIRHSGIGTCLQNQLSRLLTHRPNWAWTLFGDPEIIGTFPWSTSEAVSIRAFHEPIYSIKEHFFWLKQRRESFDLLWIPHYTIPAWWSGPILTTIHDVAHLAHPKTAPGLVKQLYARAMLGWARRRADGIVFVSSFTNTEFGSYVGRPMGISDVIHNGVDGRWFDQDATETAIPSQQRYIVFVGNVKPNKNLSGLLRAMAMLLDRIPHDLMIVGRRDGFITGDDSLEDVIAPLGQRVVFTGEVDQDALLRIVRHADLLVQPSFYEGFGLPPLEAMACGCPVAVSKAASLPEICGDAAIYFDPHDPTDIADALLSALTDEQSRLERRAHGFVRAAGFDWNTNVVRLIEMIETLLRQHPRPPSWADQRKSA